MMQAEFYRAQLMGAGASTKVGGAHVAGFLPKTGGTISVSDELGNLLVDAVPVTAGVFIRIPLLFPSSAGGTVSLGGGASGTLFV